MNHDEMKRTVVAMYSRAAELYDQVGTREFTYFGKLLVNTLNIPTGAYVLDIACGRGALLFAAAEQVSDSGQVIGIDLAPGMLTQTKSALRQRSFKQAEVVMMDADHLAFRENIFDFITCGYALHFLNYEYVLAKSLKLLKPGGFFAAIMPFVPQDDENMKQWGWLFTLTKAIFPPDFIAPAAWTAPNRLNKPDIAKATLQHAGFVDIQIQSHVVTFYFRDEDEWWDWEWSQGSRFWLEGMSAEGLTQFKHEALRHLVSMKAEKGIPIKMGALFVVGRKASE